MADTHFDPSGAVTFDFASGRVSLSQGPASVLAPAEGLSRLCEAAGQDATQAFGHAIGSSMGQRIAQRMTDLKDVSMERFIDHLRGEFALVGFGVMKMERWGHALLFVVEHAVVPPQLVAWVLSAALEASTQRTAACVKISETKEQTRFLVASQQTAERVNGWLDQDMPWGEVLVRLHTRGSISKGGGEA